MRAAVIREYGKIRLEEVEKPELLSNNVMVRVHYASICGSDQHIFKGEFHPRTKLPLIAGHEFAKAIEALAGGKLNPDKMITGILDLKDAQKGFELLEKEPAGNLKILLKV